MQTLLVVGASSGIGLETVKRALALGYKVRAFARSASRISIEDRSLEKWPGDATKGEDLGAALDGVDAVIQTLGIPAGPRMLLGPVDLFSTATARLIPAMREAGVNRLISVTGFGAGESREAIGLIQRGPFHLVFGRAYADKDDQERLIRDSGLDWVIVRPGILTSGRRTGRYHVLTNPASWRNGFVDRADVADFLVRQIDCDEFLGHTPVLVSRPLPI